MHDMISMPAQVSPFREHFRPLAVECCRPRNRKRDRFNARPLHATAVLLLVVPSLCGQVWELRGMDHTVNPQSRATYSRQSGRLLDLCMVDNSHSVASASSDGTVHVRSGGAPCTSGGEGYRAC